MKESSSMVIKNSLPQSSISIIINLFERMKFDLSPVVMKYLTAVWIKANRDTAKLLNLGNWIKFDERVLKANQDYAYSFLNKFLIK